MAFKMKGFSGFKQTSKRTTKDIMSPEGFNAVIKRQKRDSYAEPGGDPDEYQRMKKQGQKRQDKIDKKNKENVEKAKKDILRDYFEGVKSGKYKNPYNYKT